MADVEELVSLSAFLWGMKSSGNLLIAASKAFLPLSHPRAKVAQQNLVLPQLLIF